jgi:hypothetical protein
MFDDVDIEILYYLNAGVKTKDLPDYVFRSKSSIEKRKRKMKDALGPIGQVPPSDLELLEAAKLKGLI